MKFGLTKGFELMAHYQLRFFDTGDWDGNAGATSFSKRIEPLICELDYTDNDVALQIIVDKFGIEIDFYLDNEDPEKWETYFWGHVGEKPVPIESSFAFLSIMDFPRRNSEEIVFILNNFMEKC